MAQNGTRPIRVAVTGAAGQVGYALVFRIAAGEMFGPHQPVALHLIEVESALQALTGVAMELEDCAFPLLTETRVTADLAEGFEQINWAILVGGAPRKAGMERKDLLQTNGKIFVQQGKALQKYAAEDIRVLVVANPCNTNCLVCMHNAPDIPQNRFFALTRLDENRARAQIARKAGVPVAGVTNVAIWGNHSSTLYADFYNARINGKPAPEVIRDERWVREEFLATVQQRGAAIIRARGSSSAASAATAIIDTVRSIITPSPQGEWHSVAVCSDGSYGIDPGLICSFPIYSDGHAWQIVQGLSLNDFAKERIAISIAELREERDAVRELLSRT